MRQVVQSTSGGAVRVIDVPRPVIGPTEVLVRTVSSVLSPGTERAITELARSSLLAKARARPDLVRQVLKKARNEGVSRTLHTVQSRLQEDFPLGYSGAGIAIEVGEAVGGIAPGQLVATGGAGKANHAEFQSVAGLLCSTVPAGVPAEDAAFATIASIALHGLRLADVGPGARVVVLGLGLIGQLAVRLAQASGCDVAGIDLSAFQADFARDSGALGLVEAGEETTDVVLEWSRGRGADAVLLMAAGKSSSVIERTPSLCRDSANVVVVGDIGLHLDRRPFYEKELTLRFSRSYGPGRYERSYEEWAVDYPAGLVRWSEGRNLEAVLDLLAAKRLRVDDLVTHRFPIDDALDAYGLVEDRSEPFLGIAFSYPERPGGERPVILRTRSSSSAAPGIGLIGSGAFASSVLVPAFKDAGFRRFVSVASASGLSARSLAERAGFERAVSGADGVIDDPGTDVVVIATPHDTHAALTARALRAGKHVFCEKPLALTFDELDEVERALEDSGKLLFVGFNRRWSEPVQSLRASFSSGRAPLVITYRVSAGALPTTHWYHDRRQGGRLLGEVCHFIDTCAAITGSSATLVHAVGSGRGEKLLDQDIIVTLQFAEGSLATISYGSTGHPRTEKERIDVLGRGHTATILDFRQLDIDGQAIRLQKTDKGHIPQVQAFRRAIDTAQQPEWPITSTRLALEAADALRGQVR